MSLSTIAHCRTLHAGAGIALLAAIIWSPASRCLAQRNQLMAQKPAIYRILRGRSLADTQQAKAFEDYFKLFFDQLIRQSLSKDAAGPQTFPNYRHELRLFRLNGQRGAAYDRLTVLTYGKMGQIATSERCNPAARVNAMLILGELNEEEGGDPYRRAFNPLLLFAARDAFNNKPIPDELKVAAMVGLKRWAAIEGAVPANQQAALTGAMLKLLSQQTPPSGRTVGGHTWMRRLAAEILAGLGNPGPNNEVVTAYQRIIANPAARNSLRCTVAECLGKLKYKEGSKVDFASLANLIGHQTVEICQREFDAQGENPRRRLLAYSVRSALIGLEGSNGRGGLKAAASGTDGQEFVDAVRGPIDTACETAVDDDFSDSETRTAVETMINDLRLALREKPAPEPEAAEPKAPPAAQPDARAATGEPSAAAN